eukprot:m.165616 g.165616  ORF g.165616 m.165616 type:complete len:105 (-) comp24004_c0_seq3:3-317(-)
MPSKGEALAHRILKSKGRGAARAEVNYDELRDRMARRKNSGVTSATKVQKLKAEERRIAELQIIRLHRLIWNATLTRLEAERLRVVRTFLGPPLVCCCFSPHQN